MTNKVYINYQLICVRFYAHQESEDVYDCIRDITSVLVRLIVPLYLSQTLLVATCLVWLTLLWPAPAEGIELATSAYDGDQGVGDLHGEEKRLFNTGLRGSTYHRGQNRCVRGADLCVYRRQ